MSDGELFDDRLFLTSVYPGRCTRIEDGYIETVILYDQIPSDSIWVVIYYRNLPRFPIVGTYHFKNKEDALRYKSIIEPTTPLKSLGGKPPSSPMNFQDYVKWKSSQGFLDFHPDRAYTEGGENRREIIIQTQEQFDDGMRKAHYVLSTPY